MTVTNAAKSCDRVSARFGLGYHIGRLHAAHTIGAALEMGKFMAYFQHSCTLNRSLESGAAFGSRPLRCLRKPARKTICSAGSFRRGMGAGPSFVWPDNCPPGARFGLRDCYRICFGAGNPGASCARASALPGQRAYVLGCWRHGARSRRVRLGGPAQREGFEPSTMVAGQ